MIRSPFGCRPHGETKTPNFLYMWWSKPEQGRMFSIGCDLWELLYWSHTVLWWVSSHFLKINTKWVCFQTCGWKLVQNRSIVDNKDALIKRSYKDQVANVEYIFLIVLLIMFHSLTYEILFKYKSSTSLMNVQTLCP